MTAIEFLTELQRTRDAFAWEYRDGVEIRGVLKAGTHGIALDPIAAMAFVRSGGAFLTGGGEVARRLLGLSGADAAAIADAADNALWKYVEGQLVLDGYSDWLRDRLALTCGLELPDVQEFPDEGIAIEAVSIASDSAEPAPRRHFA